MTAVRHWWTGLFAKYVASLVGLVTFVLAFNGGVEAGLMYRDITNAVVRLESEKAQFAGQRIGQFIDEIERQIGWATRASAGADQRRADYMLLLQQVAAIDQLAWLDGSGKEVLNISRSGTGRVTGADYSRSPKFTQALANRVWFGPGYFRNGTEPYFTIAMAHAVRNAGVTVSEIDLGHLEDLVRTIQVGKTGYVYVIGSQGRVLARSAQYRVQSGTDVSNLPQVAPLLSVANAKPERIAHGRDIDGRSVLASSASIPRVGWSVLVEQPLGEALEPMYALLGRLAWLIGMGLVVAACAGALLARRMVVPIRALQTGASRLAASEFDHRIDVRTGDEIEVLASEFNRMATHLQESYSRLEQKVEERTRDLAQSVRELKALEEIGRAVASSLELQSVLETIVTRAVELARADAGAIYRYEASLREFRLAEAHGLDPSLVEAVRGTRIRESESAMGEAATARKPIVIADLATIPNYPLRDLTLAAGFHSVLIVPLVGPEEILGSLVVQRRETGDFPGNIVSLMQTFADQSVLAMANARLFREIEEKSRQLEIASQHKSQFLANMSHELRTPLNAVLGYAELMVDGLYGQLPDKAVGILERMQANGRHLLGLINDVLDLSKIEAGQFTLALEDYSMKSVVGSVVAATESLAQAKGLALTAEVAADLPTGRGDERRLTQVLLNIVSNAIKFTEVGSVEIRADAANGCFQVRVRDTGPGIAPQDQARIFEEFQQADNSITRQKGGTGLGLAISKHLIEMHGGTLSLQSELGVGSTFQILLPMRVEAQSTPA